MIAIADFDTTMTEDDFTTMRLYDNEAQILKDENVWEENLADTLSRLLSEWEEQQDWLSSNYPINFSDF